MNVYALCKPRRPRADRRREGGPGFCLGASAPNLCSQPYQDASGEPPDNHSEVHNLCKSEYAGAAWCQSSRHDRSEAVCTSSYQ
ncbi:MAG: hypothetical protein FRX49_02024 [Trebouxia sp. A1-2]|nr:MAG: hypothetical protein FRX49_13041 [Trebouxia sp. A1-2]KAA6427360.1 MAG: hypothetical protein FRX49_02024 [Trebouxia sp. A1-2]